MTLAGCASNPNSPDVTFPVSLTLQPGQSQSAGGLNVKFVDVMDDWRCPLNAACFSAGDAYLQFELSSNGRSTSQGLQVESPDRKHVKYEGYGVEVQSLTPLPLAGIKRDPSEYRVTLQVTR